METKTASLSGLVMTVGVSLMSVMFGLSFFDVLPFTITSGLLAGCFMAIMAAWLSGELFVEDKIKKLSDLTDNPMRMIETLLIVVSIILALVLISSVTIPYNMRGVVGFFFIVMSAMCCVELKRK